MEGLKLKDLVAAALNGYLKQPKSSAGAKPCPFPLVRSKGGPLLKRMNSKTIAKIEHDADLERYRRSLGR
jgi:hypothetical protein